MLGGRWIPIDPIDHSRSPNKHTGQIWLVCFHPDGKRFATCSFDRASEIWDVATGACLQTLWGHTKEVSRVRFSPDGTILASGRSDRTIRLWDVATGKCLHVLDGHTSGVTSVGFISTALWHACANENSSSILASASFDGTIRLWDVQTGECLNMFRPDRLYEGTNIAGITGLTQGEIATLKSLGAIETDRCS